MNQELFAEWFLHHFLEHVASSRPLMLLLDGHSSHYSLELVKLAAAHNVVMFCLPPHTTANTQPLNTSCFKPLKTSWSDVCLKYLFANPGWVITKFYFSCLISHLDQKDIFRWFGKNTVRPCWRKQPQTFKFTAGDTWRFQWCNRSN